MGTRRLPPTSVRQPSTFGLEPLTLNLQTLVMMEDRFFTLARARSLLPRIRDLTEKMVSLAGQLQRLHPEVRGLAEKGGENAGSPVGTLYLTYLLQMQDCVGWIQGLGCLVKGVEKGLVDFPHLRDGREVFLCWKLGEDDIHFWHETDAGFGGRMPLEDG